MFAPHLLRLLLLVLRLEAESRRRRLLRKGERCQWRRVRLMPGVLLSPPRWLAICRRRRVSHTQTRLQRRRAVMDRAGSKRSERRVCSSAVLSLDPRKCTPSTQA